MLKNNVNNQLKDYFFIHRIYKTREIFNAFCLVRREVENLKKALTTKHSISWKITVSFNLKIKIYASLFVSAQCYVSRVQSRGRLKP